jgi:hypothetical protein
MALVAGEGVVEPAAGERAVVECMTEAFAALGAAAAGLRAIARDQAEPLATATLAEGEWFERLAANVDSAMRRVLSAARRWPAAQIERLTGRPADGAAVMPTRGGRQEAPGHVLSIRRRDRAARRG